MENYQVAIIGGGPGGYVSAIRLNQFGISSVVFEKERLGGVCLNRGCIPTKTLVKSADLFAEIKHATSFGIHLENPTVNYPKILKRKNEIVERLVGGVEFLFKKRKIPIVQEEVISIKKECGNYIISSAKTNVLVKYIILATGSKPAELPNMKFDGKHLLTSKDLLDIEYLPEKLVVVGGGVIGCEFASIFAQLGVQIEIVEFLPRLLSTEDEEISKKLKMSLKKLGVKIHLKTAAQGFQINQSKVLLKCSNDKKIDTNLILISVGRKSNCEISFENFKIEWKNSFIDIDYKFETNHRNIFAIGDVTGKLMLAHTASKQGILASKVIKQREMNLNEKIENLKYENIPRCTFTNPEIGSVGLTETQAKEKYVEIAIGKFPFMANGKALSLGETSGFVKTIAEKSSGKLVGMHIIGAHATELIAQGSILINRGVTAEKAAEIVFAHPTLSESIAESIEDIENCAIHKI